MGAYVGNRDWGDDRTQKIDEDDCSHSKEAAETTQALDCRQFDQIVHSRVDPSST